MIWSGRYFLWCNITLSALCSRWEQVRCRFITSQYSKQTDWPLSQNSSKLELFCDMAQTAKAKPLLFVQNFHFLEAKKKPFYSRGTKESFVSILAWQTVPIGLDDPQSVKNISELLKIIDLFRGAKNTSVKRGASKPLGTVLTSANFTPTESVRYHLVILIDGYHFWDQTLTGYYDHTLEAIYRNENHFIFRR